MRDNNESKSNLGTEFVYSATFLSWFLPQSWPVLVLLSTLFCRFCKGKGYDELSHWSPENASWYWAISGVFTLQ